MSYSNIPLQQARPGLAAPYTKMVVSVLIGAGLGVGAYYYLSSKKPGELLGTDAAGSQAFCSCPNCGMTIAKPDKLDCEEINCPNCGSAMNNAATFIAGQSPLTGNAGGAPLTQNRRETLAEQGIATPGPLTQNQRETLAEQNRLPIGTAPQVTSPAVAWPQPAPSPPAAVPRTAGVDFAQPIDNPVCICPNCGNRVEPQAGFSCTHMRCPVCNSAMTNAIFIGRAQDMKLVNLDTAPPAAAALVPVQAALHGTGACPRTAAAGGNPAPCPLHGGGGMQQPSPAAAPPSAAMNAQDLTYSNDIKPIIDRNCLRCHGGPIRTLRTYDQVKAYADNGLLKMMTQPGGPMSRFLTAEESQQISAWIDSGARP